MGEEPTYSTVVKSSPTVAIDAIVAGHVDGKELKDLLSKDNATLVAAFGKGKEPSSSAAAAKTTTVGMEANLMVSTGNGEFAKKLKNLLSKQDATVTVVATVSRKNQQASEAIPSLTSLQLRFLAAASNGNLEKLTRLLSRTGDVEEGTTSADVVSLLESVTTEGDTALHLVATNGSSGDCEDYERCAEFLQDKCLLYSKKDNEGDTILLYKKNNKGDTPLHCAVRAGRSQLVSCLIGLAKVDGKVQSFLRMENKKNDTALHEAVRMGDKKMVKYLLRADPKLASFPTNGISPLYLAIQQIDDREAILRKEDKQESDDHLTKKEERSMAQTLHDEGEDGSVSYLGPNGQNALHAAVVRRSPELARKLCRWNKDLAIQRDGNGSTPLHFAAGLLGEGLPGSVLSVVFNTNTDALYQMDNDGLSPIHVAAYVGAAEAISLFVNKCPGSAGLRDAKGRTFLHVAVDNKNVHAVRYAGQHPSVAWIMNMQDNDGNTALHLAVKDGSLLLFCPLFANRKVNLNIANAKGETPLDIAVYKVPPGLSFNQNSEVRIRRALEVAGARSGASRRDHFKKKYDDAHGLKSVRESKELEKLKELTQTRSIAAVLIATVAFGATFALPGGYRADDGTPMLAGRYAFDAFMMANTLAFIFSAATVICLVRGGSPSFNLTSRKLHTAVAYQLMEVSVTCLTAAFALGVFVVLSPVAPKTARAICVMSGIALVICKFAEFWPRWIILLRSYCVRIGPLRTARLYTWLAIVNLCYEYWPFLLIFLWAAYGRTHPITNVEPPARPPSV